MPHFQYSSVNEQGYTPLHVAAIAGKNGVIEVWKSLVALVLHHVAFTDAEVVWSRVNV